MINLKVLVTGGAGFIGSHLVDGLLNKKGYDVTVLDILEEQVHGKKGKPPKYLNENANFICGSVTDYRLLKELVESHNAIFHLAAMVGVGQSMYQIEKYVNHNILGTANLLDILANSNHNLQKLVIASSNTVYGEGKYECEKCGIIYPPLREESQLKEKDWELHCPNCNSLLSSLPTDEDTPFDSSSVYALSKQHQEELGLLVGETYDIDTTILRFFLVYGPRQSLSNPYTGVCSIFSSRLLNNKAPIIFEDGQQTRDFVHVADVCQSMLLALEKKEAKGEIFNVGSGNAISISEVAETITNHINPELKPIYTQKYRIGDIRHCIADITKIKEKLGFNPTITFQQGIEGVIEWIKENEQYIQDESQKAIDELNMKGLIK